MTKKADTNNAQNYSSKATAKRGAKRQYGDAWEKQFTVEQSGDRWVLVPIEKPAPASEPVLVEKTTTPGTTNLPGDEKPHKCNKKDLVDHMCPECGAHIGKHCPTCGHVYLYKKGHPHLDTCSKFVKPAPIKRVSDIESPCHFVWDTADTMSAEGATRKQIIDACLAAGVAFYTARTQYQLWFKAKNASN